MELFAIKNLRTNRYYNDTILNTDLWGFESGAKRMPYDTARTWADAIEAEGQVIDIVKIDALPIDE